MTTCFLLLRHAETTHPHVFNGFEADVELSPLGHRQARAVAPVLAAASPDVVISSGMKRAMQTATPIAVACGVTLRIEPDLHERKVGTMCGKPHAEVAVQWQETLRHWTTGDLDFAPAGGESYRALQQRVVPVFQRLATELSGKTLAVIAHGHVCRILLLSLLAEFSASSWEAFGPIHNLALTELHHSGQAWQALRINEKLAEVERASSDE